MSFWGSVLSCCGLDTGGLLWLIVVRCGPLRSGLRLPLVDRCGLSVALWLLRLLLCGHLVGTMWASCGHSVGMLCAYRGHCVGTVRAFGGQYVGIV